MSVNNINYYQILGINKNATQKDIISAYHKLALKWHPDKNRGNEELAKKEFQKVKAAYEVLSDEEKRKNYDLGGSGNGVGSNDWWKNKGNSMFGESIERLKELFVFYGANESDLDPNLWTPFASWEDKAWNLYEKEVNKHNDFLELLREESQKAGARKKSSSPVENNTSEPKEIEDKKDSKTLQIPHHNEESPKENPVDKGAMSKVEIVNNIKKGGDNDNKSSSENKPLKQNKEKLVISLSNIEKITLTSKGELVIEFSENKGVDFVSQTITNEQLSQSQELQKAKNYLQKENRQSLSKQEFNSLVNSNSSTSPTNEKPKSNYGLLVGGGITVLGVVVGLLISKRKNKKVK